MKPIDQLIPDIQTLFDKGITLSDLALETFTSKIGINLKERFEEYTKERKPYLRLSNVGKPLRQLWFEIASGLKPEPLSAETKFKFLYGDLLEDLVILLAIEAGHTVTDLQRKVEIDGVLGSIDCICDDFLIDAKSCSTFSFQKFRNETLREDDPFGYIGQLSGYHTALVNANVSLLGSAFIAIDKVIGNLYLFKLTQEEINKYNVKSRINEARGVLKLSTPPQEKCYSDVPDGVSKTAPNGNGNRVLATGCSYCGHKWNCWEGLRGFIYSGGPKFFTVVNKQPNVFEMTYNNKKED